MIAFLVFIFAVVGFQIWHQSKSISLPGGARDIAFLCNMVRAMSRRDGKFAAICFPDE